MPFKMKGFPMLKGTGAMKAMKESAMKAMHASPKKAMKESPKKAMKESPKKAMSPKKKMTDLEKAISTRKRDAKPTDRKVKKITTTPPGGGEKYAEKMRKMKESRKTEDSKYETLKREGKASPKKKLKADPPETQAKIKKMILSGIEKGKDDRDIMKKINSMSSGNVEYTYNRNTKKVKVRKKGSSGFEGELETDPDKE